jgi:mutual gliding-motility protein MglA
MAQINFGNRTLTGKLVYYGPGLAGKTTNLEAIYEAAPKSKRGKLTSIATSGDRTIFFDYFPLQLGTVGGLALTLQLYTVPGQSYYAATRRLVLTGVDGVVFVADSSPDRLAENVASFDELLDELRRQGHRPQDVPLVIQWNKRDVSGALAIPDLERALNPFRAPSHSAIANQGEGVLPTLRAATKLVLRRLREQYSGEGGAQEQVRLETETHDPSDSVAEDDATPGVVAESGSAPKHVPVDHDVGDAVGGCVILAKLGEGGMGSAYLARLKNDPKQTVVVKTMKPGREATQARVQRFFREARSAARLDHENVVKVEEVGTDERGMHYMIMQHVKGEDLKTHVEERGRLDPYEAARIIIEVAKALVATHKAGVIHRDVKPANVVIGKNGDVKLIDFGLSRDLRLNDELTRSGGVVGTIMYMAPELFRGAEADQRVDVYSLGLTFYFLLTGRAPFSGCVANEVIGGLAKLKKPSEGTDLPTGFRRVIEGMLARDPALRYATADVVIRELERLWELEVPGDDESDGFWLWEVKQDPATGSQAQRKGYAPWSPAVLPQLELDEGSDHFASQVVTALHAWDALDERSQAPNEASEEISSLIDQAWGDEGWSGRGAPAPDPKLLEGGWEAQLSNALAELESKPVKAHQRKRLSRDPGQALVDALLKRGPARGGTQRFKRDKLKLSIKELTKEIKSNSEHPQPWTKRGIARARGGDLKGAITDYTKALDADPAYLPALANRASAHFHLKQYRQAETECTRTLKRAPRLAKAWLFRGISRAVLRRPGAREDMMRFLKLSPYSPRVGYIRKLLKEFDERSAKQKKKKKKKKRKRT